MRILLLLIYLGGTFSPLLDISERNYFRRWGGGGCTLLRTRLNWIIETFHRAVQSFQKCNSRGVSCDHMSRDKCPPAWLSGCGEIGEVERIAGLQTYNLPCFKCLDVLILEIFSDLTIGPLISSKNFNLKQALFLPTRND